MRPPLSLQPVFNRHRSTTITHIYSVSCLREAISARAGLVKRVRAHAHESLHGRHGGTRDIRRQGPTEGFILIR